MRDTTYLILVALDRGERHGYGITQDVAALSDGQVRLGAGTLYGALDRLVAQGLVKATRSETVACRLRRYYELTDEGVADVRVEALRRLEVGQRTARQLGLSWGGS